MKKLFLSMAFAPVSALLANPCVTDHYTPDPAPVVDGDTVWVFTGHDMPGSYFTMPNWQVLSSSDMKTWKNHGVVLTTEPFKWAKQGNDAWASQAIKRGDKWYWYVAIGDLKAGLHGIGVAVADSPLGPWTDAIGAPLVPGDWGYIDPSVMIDDDGQAWLFWGNNNCWYAPLKANMIEIDDELVRKTAADHPELKLVKGRWFEVPGLMDEKAFGPHKMREGKPHTNFEEAPWIYRRGETYYMEYAAGGVPEHWAYSTAPSIHGPWTYRGKIFDCAEKSFTIHGGSITFKGKSYCFYHAGTAPGGGGFQRSTCFEPFEYGADGSIPHIPFSKTDTSDRPNETFALGYETPVAHGGLSFAFQNGGKWTFERPYKDRIMYSNLGNWGDKALHHPFVLTDREGAYHVFHGFVGNRPALAHARSWNNCNIRNWGRENWIELEKCRLPAHVGGLEKDVKVEAPVVKLREDGLFDVWVRETKAQKAYKILTNGLDAFKIETIDYADYERQWKNLVRIETVEGQTITGAVVKVNLDMRDLYRTEFGEWHPTAPFGEAIDEAKNDAREYGELAPAARLKMSITPEKFPYPISKMLIGCFFEDINHSADGGLVAEKLQNGDFEFVRGGFGHGPGSERFKSETWRIASGARVELRRESPVHENNSQYVHCEASQAGVLLENIGWDGVSLKKGERYTVSAWVRGKANFSVSIGDAEDARVSQWEEVPLQTPRTDGWRRIKGEFKATQSIKHALFVVQAEGAATFDLDMISLMPQKTYKNHGLRLDLAKAIEGLNPKFLRFPGGCIVHGPNFENMYRWKDTVGAYETRKGQGNMWGGRQTYRLGFYEYFQFCEDVGMEPVPIVSAGVTCPNPQDYMTGPQLDAWVKDVLDLIDFAKGDPEKSPWAKLRAEMGHPQPFKLNYLGIGNEDDINDYFERGFVRIREAVQAKDPSIKIVGSAGATFAGRDYEEGWRLGKRLRVDIIDEHYYVGCGWYYGNQNFYDSYDRHGPKVYVGEYAAHKNGVNDMETALACALHLTNLERNGDVVEMASYAPLFGKEGFLRWKPDLIYFTDSTRTLTTDYWVQWMFGHMSGETYIPHALTVEYGAGAQADAGRQKRFRNRFSSSIVRKDKTTYVKLVNTTSFALPIDLDLSDLHLPPNVTLQVASLTGKLTDTHVKPQIVDEAFQVVSSRKLPAHSLTVLIIKEQ